MSSKAQYISVNLHASEHEGVIVIRVFPSGKVEALYEQKRGPIKLLRWDTGYIPSGHNLARFTLADAEAYTEFENKPDTSDEF